MNTTNNILVIGNDDRDKLKWINTLKFRGFLKFYNRNAIDYIIKTQKENFRLTMINSSITLKEFISRYSILNPFILIVWDGINHPDNLIKEVNEHYNNTFCKPYQLILANTKGLPKLVSQQIINWNRGINIVRSVRLRKVLKKVAFKYWYEDLDVQGYSRMCKKDVNQLVQQLKVKK